SLVGSTANDSSLMLTIGLSNGNYISTLNGWDNSSVTDAGALAWGNGTSGATGVISAANSAIGSSSMSSLVNVPIWDNVNGTFYGRFVTDGSGHVRGGSQAYGFADGPAVASVVVGDGTTQRSMVEQLVVNFSTPVTFNDVSAFRLTRTGP